MPPQFWAHAMRPYTKHCGEQLRMVDSVGALVCEYPAELLLIVNVAAHDLSW